MNEFPTRADAERIAAEVFGVAGRASPLPGEIDRNFKIEASTGTYVLKLAPPSVDERHLEARTDAMDRLAQADIGYHVSRPVPSASGERVVRIAGGSAARIVTWVAGTPFAHADRPAGLAPQIGRLAGTIAANLASFDHPGLHRDSEWDLHRAGVVIDRLGSAVVDPRRRAMVERVRAGYAARVEPLLHELPRQTIHGDLNDLNIMIGDGRVSGFIDFGDLGYSIRVGEVAIAAVYTMLGQDDPLTVGRAVVEGFVSVVALEPDELALVFDLVLARLAVSACMAAHRRDPANPHLTVSEEQVWDLLERFDAADQLAASAELAGSARPPATSDLHARRRALLGPNLSLSYAQTAEGPLTIVRGEGAYLYDIRGRRYLDCVNNVAHVGHSHPTVVAAQAAQAAVLNTNTRYLHPTLADYAERLAARLPAGLDVVYLTNSGSEANELAIRMARAATGRHDVAVFDHGYHGNTSTLVAISPYKFKGPGGDGKPDWVRLLPNPDPYRTRFGGADAATTYREVADEMLQDAAPAALIAEAIIGCGGQVVPAEGVLAAAYAAARDAGAVCIADEVQTGFGRVGSAFWAFELHNVSPDIVTLGKPIGNGHPLGAVVTTRTIADAFANGMEYFNTFGGNPVSAAVGAAVLDVIFAEGLQENARLVGDALAGDLRRLAVTHPVIGDVRGAGLFLGIELVEEGDAKTPAAGTATSLVAGARRRGVLVSIDGPHGNVIKIKPPLVFSEGDAARLVETLDGILTTERS